MDCFKICRKKHWFSYELGIRRSDDSKPLRMGSAYHEGLEILETTGSIDGACEAVYSYYQFQPENINQIDWEYERETVLRLLCGYKWRWENDPIEYLAAEQEFHLPLINPATAKASRTFTIDGKIDGIIRVNETGRVGVMEHKLLSEDIASDSPLWKRLRIDHQISLYVLAARRLGHQADFVFYSVTRKPTIKPTAVPILDELGTKIVLDHYGNRVLNANKTFRQTGDTEKGYVLQQRMMTAEEWGAKLSDDIAARPEFYYARKEIQRLDTDLAEYESELWDIQKAMRDAQLNDRHYRTCNKETCAWCGYFSICTEGWRQGDSLPEGFVQLENKHPELKGETNVNSTPATA